MSRARIRKEVPENIIETIRDKELRKIAIMYFIEKQSKLDIAFELNYSERTIQRRIKEVKSYRCHTSDL